jgi:hypothetical protein
MIQYAVVSRILGFSACVSLLTCSVGVLYKRHNGSIW